MKTKVRIALVALLGIALFVAALPISLARPISSGAPDHQDGRERRHYKKGPEVGNRVRQLQKYNKNVRRALADFERNEKRHGHKPQIDEAESITLDPGNGTAALNMANYAPSPFRKASFKPMQDPDYSEYGLEMIFIPTYSVPGEWQGTIIINKFDPSGGYLGQYVADVVIRLDSTQPPDVPLEISYDGGEAYLEYGDPNAYPYLGDPGVGGEGFVAPMISSVGRSPSFEKASFTPQSPWTVLRIGNSPRVRWVLKCTAIGSAGGAVGCGITSIFTGGATFGPCALGGVGASFTVCTLTAIFG